MRRITTRHAYVKNLKRLREKRGLTQREVAELVGVTPLTLSQWESDRATPTVENLMALADVFRVSMDFLVGRKTPHVPEDMKPKLVALRSADDHEQPMVG